jgi:hypothetical protein
MMKASIDRSFSPPNELVRGVAAIAVGAAMAYGGACLFTVLRPMPLPAAPTVIEVTPSKATVKALMVEPPTPGEDPWWRGDAAFWQEQARLNSAAVAPQYRDLQFAWSEQMAANARQRALKDPSGREPLAMPAKEAQTTELQIPAPSR